MPTRVVCAPRARRYLAWVRDELLLVALLAAALALFLANPALRDPYALPSLRLFLDTAVLLVAVIVSVLAYVRFSVERRRFDLCLFAGFFVTAADHALPSRSPPRWTAAGRAASRRGPGSPAV